MSRFLRRDLLHDAMQRSLLRQRLFRDRNHPLEIYDDLDLYQKFRFRHASILYITTLLYEDSDHPTKRNCAVPPVIQLLCALRFYATGSFQIVVGDSTAALSQSIICRFIRRLFVGLVRRLNEYIKYPTAHGEIEVNKKHFFDMAKFPQVTGLINCTHIRIQKP